jgi:hypothetical protein
MRGLSQESASLGRAATAAIVRPSGIGMKLNREHRARTTAVVTLAILLAGGAALMSAAQSSAARHQARAHAAFSLNGTATAHLHLVKPNGRQLLEEGPLTGAIPGSMRAVFDTGNVFTGSFTIRTHGGTIEGRGRATPHGLGRYQSFSGTITLTGGTGRYTQAKGHAGLYGTFDRRTYALVIQTTGRFSY